MVAHIYSYMQSLLLYFKSREDLWCEQCSFIGVDYTCASHRVGLMGWAG